MTALRFKKVRAYEDADERAVKLTLFESRHGHICGGYVGPLKLTSAGVDMLGLPECSETPASLAIVRAIQAARSVDLPVCVVDPDDLWEPAWRP